MIESVQMFIQVIVALGIFNVWIVRFRKSTQWRGGGAQDMRAEFEVYGLPSWFMFLIGAAKISLASCLIAGLWVPAVTRPAAMGLAALMLGAVSMHVKVRDPIMRSLPAISMLIMSLFVAFADHLIQ